MLCGLVAAVAALAAVTPGVAFGATTTTINFDDLAPGTKVTNQYDARGVGFVRGIVGSAVYCDPVIVVPADGTESGTQAAGASCANGEFPDSSIRGQLNHDTTSVSVFVGYVPPGTPAVSAPVTLNAYDVLGDVVKTASTTLAVGQATNIPLAVSSSTANIVAFDVTSTQPGVSIDDLTFDNPAGVPADFAISAADGLVRVAQGSSTSDVVAIQRLNGSSGGVSFSASSLPAGVHATFSPNPANGATTTMTVSADANATLPPSGPLPSFTVTGTPMGRGVGATPRSLTVDIGVQPLFTIFAPTSVSVPPCSTRRVPITVSAPPGFSGTVSLSANGVPSDDQASFEPATLSLPSQTHGTLVLTSQSDIAGPAGDVSVTATGGGASDTSDTFPVTRVPPSITSLTDPSGMQQLTGGQAPQGTSPGEGTLVVVHGQGFCPGSTVYFGNALASAASQGPIADGLGPFGDGTALRTSVPSLATSGDVYVVPPGGSLGSLGTVHAPFNVDSYRNVNGFPFANTDDFQNRVGGYGFGDVSAVFGDEATHVSVNPCWPFGDCSITTPIPDPSALLFWGVANEALQGGQCFGFSLASQRFLHGDQILPPFPFQPGVDQASVWNLEGPDVNGASGASGSIAHFVHLTHLEQFSAEALHFWLGNATLNALVGSQASIMGEVTSALRAGDHPLIELRNGTEGHVVVAYGIDQVNGSTLVGPGDRVIDVYNPNQQFTLGENALDGLAHQFTLSTSEIVVHPDGHWEFQGFSPEWHAGPGSLVVMPYGTVPLQPTLPDSASGLVDLLFGSAHATQVTDSHGRTLLNSDGSLNTSASSAIPDATQFATLSGTPKPGPGIFLFGRPGAYTTSVRGDATGTLHDALFGHGFAASIAAPATSAVKDLISVPASMDGVSIGESGPGISKESGMARFEVVVNGAEGSRRTATVTTKFPIHGQAEVMFDRARNAVNVKAGDEPTSSAVVLSWTGPHGIPQTFVAPTLHLGAGERATLTPADWSSLQTSTVTLHVTHANGGTTTRTLKNNIHPTGRFTVALKITRAGTAHQLMIATRFTRVAPQSSALVAWEVFKGPRLVAHHTVMLAGARLRRGLVRLSFRFNGLASAQYTLRASVELLTPTHAGTYLSQQQQRHRRFQG